MDTVIDADHRDAGYRPALGTGRAESEASLRAKDIAAFVLAAVMTLGPLAAATLFR